MSAAVPPGRTRETVTLALCGDVMLGRGIDQVLPEPSDPVLYETGTSSARTYVALAEALHGPIPRPAAPGYVWGDALAALLSIPDRRIVNLETSITVSMRAAAKGINYRMHPRNISCLVAAGIDCCTLANNHVLDWGSQGLLDTLGTLAGAGIEGVGAGRDATQAKRPAVLSLPSGGRAIVVACGADSAGVPREWAAGRVRPGIHFLPDLTDRSAARLGGSVLGLRRTGDIAIVSLHWGPNWGYDVPRHFREFARALVDVGGFDVVFGHSSHHPKGMEVYNGRLVVYGAGDFLNDYEGIRGYEAFRGDLACLYLATLKCSTGELIALEILPFQIRRFRLGSPSVTDRTWLANTLDRECRPMGSRIVPGQEQSLSLTW
jgi:poly-gamma-glutamate capsule biosynthesis protein CapA/YwtB (metallophosphatase superfamily)